MALGSCKGKDPLESSHESVIFNRYFTGSYEDY